MELQHARMLKTDLEKAITKLVHDFESQTGLVITSIRQGDCHEFGRRAGIEVVTIFK